MRDQVLALLEALGILDAASDPLLTIVIDQVTQSLLNDTNQRSLPTGLQQVALYRMAGQYLNLKKSVGQLEGFDLDAAVKQIKEGDTTVGFAVGEGSQSPEQRLDSLISFLSAYGLSQLAAYRRLSW